MASQRVDDGQRPFCAAEARIGGQVERQFATLCPPARTPFSFACVKETDRVSVQADASGDFGVAADTL